MNRLVPCLLLGTGGLLGLVITGADIRFRKSFLFTERISATSHRDLSASSSPPFLSRETSPELTSHRFLESRYEQEESNPVIDFVVEETKPNFQKLALESHSAPTVPSRLLQRNSRTIIQAQSQSNGTENQHRSWLELVKRSTRNSTVEKERPNPVINWQFLMGNNHSVIIPVTPPLNSLMTQRLPQHLKSDEIRELAESTPNALYTQTYRKSSKANQTYLNKKINSLRSYHRTSQEMTNSARNFAEDYWDTFSVIPELSTQDTETQPSINSSASHLQQEALHRTKLPPAIPASLGDENIPTADHKQQEKNLSTRNPELQSTQLITKSTEKAGLSKLVDSTNTMSPPSISEALFTEYEALYPLNITNSLINSVRPITVWKMQSPENATSLVIPEVMLQHFPKESKNKLNTNIRKEYNDEVTDIFSVPSPDLHSITSGASLSYNKQQEMPHVLQSLLKHTTVRDLSTRDLKVSELPTSTKTSTHFQKDTNFTLSVENSISDSSLFSEFSFGTEYTKLSSTELNILFSQRLTKPSTLASHFLSELSTVNLSPPDLTRSFSAPEGPTLTDYSWSEGTMSMSRSPPELTTDFSTLEGPTLAGHPWSEGTISLSRSLLELTTSDSSPELTTNISTPEGPTLAGHPWSDGIMSVSRSSPELTTSDSPQEFTTNLSTLEGPIEAGHPWLEGTVSVSYSPPELTTSDSASELTRQFTSLLDPVTDLYDLSSRIMTSLKTPEDKPDITSQWTTMPVILPSGTKHAATKISEPDSSVNSIGMFSSPFVQSLETPHAKSIAALAAENQPGKDFTSSPGTGFERPNSERNVPHTTKLIPIPKSNGPTDFPSSAERLDANQRTFIMQDQPPVFKGNVMPVTCRLVLEKDFIPSFENPESLEYQTLALSFQETVLPFYKLVPGFQRLDLLRISQGTVVLDYNALFRVESDSALLKDLHFTLDMTGLPKSIKSGLTIANSTVISLSISERQADLCREVLQCPPGFVCINDRNSSASCTSLCYRGFCKNNGICIHHRQQEPRCQCPIGSDYWFMGMNCDYRMSQQTLVGITCAVILAVFLTLALIIYLLMRHFKALLKEAKLSQTKSSYRRFSRFDDISTRYWSWSDSWATTSGNSLDNPAYNNSEEHLHLQMLERYCSACQDTAATQENLHFPEGLNQSFPYDWAMSISGITTQTMDSGKVSEMTLYSWPVQPMQWTPPTRKQTTAQIKLRAERRSSYCEGMELTSMEKSWTV